MEPSIPIPTDNVFKFAALFGLVVLISAILGFVYTYGKYFDRGYADFLELEVLKGRAILSSDDTIRKTTLEKKLNTDQANKKILIKFFLACLGGSIVLSGWGGFIWMSKIQPKQDELLNLQIEKMKREIQVLEKKLEKPHTE